MKSRDIRYKFLYPKNDSSNFRGAGSLRTELGSLGLVSGYLHQKVNRLEKFCQNLQTNPGGKGFRRFRILHQTELMEALTQIIDELPPQEKILFSLYYCEKLNFKEIGEVLGYSELKTGMLFRNGMKKVAAKLQRKADN